MRMGRNCRIILRHVLADSYISYERGLARKLGHGKIRNKKAPLCLAEFEQSDSCHEIYHDIDRLLDKPEDEWPDEFLEIVNLLIESKFISSKQHTEFVESLNKDLTT